MTKPDFRKGREDFARQCRKYGKTSRKWLTETLSVQSLRGMVPISIWLPKYKPYYLLHDLLAGLMVALIIIPQSLALAQIAHVPPHYGLYSGIMCSFVYAIFGSGRDVSLGLTPVMAILCFQFCETPVPGNATYVAILSMMTGCLELFMAFFHVDVITKFISIAVLSGFLSGVAVIMIWTQVKVISDIPNLPKDLKEFAPSVREVFRRITEFNYWNVIVAAVCLVVLLSLKGLMDVGEKISKKVDKDTPRTKRVLLAVASFLGAARYAIVVICSAAVGASLVADEVTGTPNVTLVGDWGVPDGLPQWRVPNLTLDYDNITVSTGAIYKRIGGGFFTMPLVSVLEALAVAKAMAFKSGYRLDYSQETFTVGVANLLGCFIGAIPVSASHSSSAANAKAGVKSQLGGVFTGLVVVLVVGTLTPYIRYIPTAALAAIIMTDVAGMFDITFVWKTWKAKKADFFPYLFMFFLAIFEDIEVGIVTSICLSIGIILYSQAHSKILVRHEKLEENGDTNGHHHNGDDGIVSLTTSREVLVFQPSGGLYFTQAETLRDRILNEVHEDDGCLGVVIDLTHVYFIDTSGIHFLESWHDDLSSRKIKVVYACLNGHRYVEKTLKKFNIKDFQQASTVEDAVHLLRESARNTDHRIDMADSGQNPADTHL